MSVVKALKLVFLLYVPTINKDYSTLLYSTQSHGHLAVKM